MKPENPALTSAVETQVEKKERKNGGKRGISCKQGRPRIRLKTPGMVKKTI